MFLSIYVSIFKLTNGLTGYQPDLIPDQFSTKIVAWSDNMCLLISINIGQSEQRGALLPSLLVNCKAGIEQTSQKEK